MKKPESTAEDQNGITIANRFDSGIRVGNTKIIWGVGCIENLLPVQNAPAGEQRIVLGNKSAGKIYIKNGNRVRCFILEIENGKLSVNPKLEQKGDYYFPAMPELP